MNKVKPETKPDENICPKCGNPLGDIVTTGTGRKLRRCTAGSWNAKTHQNEGCDYTLWIPFEPQELDEKCPKCGKPLVLSMTRFGKKMKKCSTGGWDREKKVATGCTYVMWLKSDTAKNGEEFLPPEE